MTPYMMRIARLWMARVGMVGLAAVALNGCPEDAQDLTESASEPAYNFPVTPAYVEPQGSHSIDRFALADIDSSRSDAFGRAVSLSTPGISGFSGCPTDDTLCPGWEFPLLNATQDTRLPALQDDDASASISGIIHDSIFGVPVVTFSLAGLAPSTQYTITLERLALTVNGGLDATHILLNNPDLGGLGLGIDPQPDELTRLGGAPGSTLGSNYYTIATFTTNAQGASGFITPDFVGTGDSRMLETNTLSSFALPKYNYVVIYQGSPDAAVPVMRAQVGVELLADGDPVNNGLAPFPQAALTPGEVLAGPGGAGRPDSLTVTFNSLEELAGGAEYEAWLVNPQTEGRIPATGTYNLIRIIAERDPVTGEIIGTSDELVSSTPGVASFVGGDEEDGFRHQLVISDATLPGGAQDSVGFYTQLFLTITDSPGGAEPSDEQPLWTAYTDQNGTPEDLFDDAFSVTGVTRFGSFNGGVGPRIFGAQGGGLGGFRESVLSVDLQLLSRPPIGYAYEAWLVTADGEAVPLPDVTGPPPERRSLLNADVETIQGLVTSTGILKANSRVTEDGLGRPFSDFVQFFVTLEPKAGLPGMGSIPTQSGAVPDPVAGGS